VATGTNAELANVSGKTGMKIAPWAAWADFARRPMFADSQLIE
jgi:hypothetical protein